MNSITHRSPAEVRETAGSTTKDFLKGSGLLLCVALLVLMPILPASAAGSRAPRPSDAQAGEQPLTVFVDVHATTWMARGRFLFDVVAVVRNKLRAAGITVIRKETQPHVLTLAVDYREQRGRQYSFDMFGTIITCRFRLLDAQTNLLWELSVREESEEEFLGTPPYIEAIEKFETNPYVYLIGDIVRGRIRGLDQTEAIIQGSKRLVESISSGIDPLSTPHTMMEAETQYETRARNRALQELGRLGDPKATPLLTDLLDHQDQTVRRLAETALDQVHAAQPATSP